MAADPVVIELGGQKILWTSDMKVVSASRMLGTVSKALRNEDDADYQIPVGKVFRILQYTFQGAGSGLIEGQIYDSSSAGGSTSTDSIQLFGAGENQVAYIPTEHDIAAGRYVNGKTAGANYVYCTATGIEMDA